MVEYITTILTDYNAYMKEIFGNQDFLISTITMAVIGIIGVIIRYIPSALYYQFKKHLTIVINIDSSHESYYNVMQNIFNGGLIHKSKFINIKNGKWGYDAAELQLGEGVQFFIIKKIPVLVIVRSNLVRDTILYTVSFYTLTLFSKKLLNVIYNSATIDRHVKDKTRIIKFSSDMTDTIYQNKETLKNTVTIKPAEKVITHIKDFINNKDYYYKNGITYKTGIIMHGIPGSGKTSLIRAIAGEFNFNIFLIKSISNLEKVVISRNTDDDNKISLIVLEEIDKLVGGEDSNKGSLTNKINDVQLSTLLQDLDGIIRMDNVIIMATTNYIDKLDKALLRPGRFDCIVEFGYIDNEEFNKFLDFYYGKQLPNNNFRIKDTTPAEIQKEFLSGISYDEMIDKFVISN